MTELNASAAAEPMRPSEILDKAADIVERNGWTKGEWYRPVEMGPDESGADGGDVPENECPVCAGAAINLALKYLPDYQHDDDFMDENAEMAFTALAARVDHEVRQDVETGRPLLAHHLLDAVTSWNDRHDRTADEVVAELRAAAASEREAGR
jgi:hypothetical protein